MTRRQAEALARRIEREDSQCRVTNYRHYGDSWGIDVVDTRTGIPFVISSPSDWQERINPCQAA